MPSVVVVVVVVVVVHPFVFSERSGLKMSSCQHAEPGLKVGKKWAPLLQP